MKTLMLSLAACGGALLAWQQASVNPAKLPAPYATESSTNRPRVIDRPGGAQLQLPAGFQIEEYATGFEKPRCMIDGPSGELLLTDSVNNGTVFLLENNGKSKKKLISALDRPYGMAFWTGGGKTYLYVAET